MIFAESMDKVFENILQARPTVVIAVPRIFEKVYSAIIEQVEEQNVLKRKYFDFEDLPDHLKEEMISLILEEFNFESIICGIFGVEKVIDL